MYHVKITNEETGEIEIDRDVEFVSGALGSNEDRNTFSLSTCSDPVRVMVILDLLGKESTWLYNTYIREEE